MCIVCRLYCSGNALQMLCQCFANALPMLCQWTPLALTLLTLQNSTNSTNCTNCSLVTPTALQNTRLWLYHCSINGLLLLLLPSIHQINNPTLVLSALDSSPAYEPSIRLFLNRIPENKTFWSKELYRKWMTLINSHRLINSCFHWVASLSYGLGTKVGTKRLKLECKTNWKYTLHHAWCTLYHHYCILHIAYCIFVQLFLLIAIKSCEWCEWCVAHYICCCLCLTPYLRRAVLLKRPLRSGLEWP